MAVERFSAIVGANIREFQRKIREVDRKMREVATGSEVDVRASIRDFTRKMKQVKKEVELIEALNTDVKVDADIKKFKIEMAKVEAAAAAIDNLSPDVNIRAVARQFFRKMREVKREMASLHFLNRELKIDADLSRFNRAMKILKARILSLERRSVWVTIRLNTKKLYSDFRNSFARLATNIRNWGEILGHTLIGSLIALIPTLSPLLSSLVGLIGSLGVMAGVAGTNLFALASSFLTAGAAAGAFALVAVPTIKELFDENVKLNAQQKKAVDALDRLKATYEGLVKETQKPVLSAFTKAMDIANKLLQDLRPLVLDSAKAVDQLMSAFQKNIEVGPVQDFIGYLNANGAKIFTVVAKSAGELVKGLMSLITAFVPLTAHATKGFYEMSKGFSMWAQGLSSSKKFQAFIDYVRENVPKISTIFGKGIEGVVFFFAGFSGLASDFMTKLAEMMTSFSEWAKGLGENQSFQNFLNFIREATPKVVDLLGNLWETIINVGSAMAPYGQAVLDIVNRFLEWFNAMMETNKLFKDFVGFLPVLIGGFMMIMTPLVALKVLITGPVMGAIRSLTQGFQKISPALSKVTPIFSKVGGAISRVIPFFTNLASRAVPLLVRAFGLLSGPIGWVITIITTLISVGIALYKNWDTIKEHLEKLGEFFVKTFTTIRNFVIEKFTELTKGIVSAVAEWVTSIPGKIGELKDAAVEKFIEFVAGIGEKMLEAKDQVVEKWQEATDFLTSIDLLQIGKDVISGLIKGITSKFKDVASSLSKLTDYIPSWVKEALGIFSPSRVMAEIGKWIPIGLAKGILDNLRSVRNASEQMTETAFPDFSKKSFLPDRMKEGIESTLSKAAKKSFQEQYDALEEYAKWYKDFYGMTTQEEMAFWNHSAKLLKDGTAAKRWALENYNKAYEQSLKEQFDEEKAYIDKALKYNKLSLTEQIKAYEHYMKQYAEGSEQRIYYEEQVYEKKKELHEKIKSLSEEFTSKMLELQQKQIDGEKQLREEFAQTLKDKKREIAGFTSLFSAFEGTDMEGVNLIDNLESQVDALYSWVTNLQKLSERGLSEELLNEIREMGASAANEVQALVNMSDKELSKFQHLWETKMQLADTQAKIELEGDRLKMEEDIKALTDSTQAEMAELQTQFAKDLRELRYGAEDELDYLTVSLPTIGRNAVQGLIDGMKSMEGKLREQASNISKIVNDALGVSIDHLIRSSNDIKPQLNYAGLNQQVNNINVAGAKVTMPEPNELEEGEEPIQIIIHQEWNGEDVLYYVENNQSRNYDFEVRRKG